MKAISIAMALAVVSTPALARRADHPRHARYHVERVAVTDAWQPYGSWPAAASPGFAVQPRARRVARVAAPGQGAYSAMVARHAAANGIPASLVHRVIMRESGYNPRAVSKGNYGMMQIKLGTARAMGYTGSAAGLLDPEVNMTYAVKYLAGAYKAAGGSEGGAVANYARGYYAQAKRRGVSPYESPATSFAMQTATPGYEQQARYQRAARRGRPSYEAPTFAMETPRRGVRVAGNGSYVVTPMTADRHMVF
jgi:soluble lytic murein transglycosylase-like protein